MRKTIYAWSGQAGNWRVERELEKRKIKKAIGEAVGVVVMFPMLWALVVLISVL